MLAKNIKLLQKVAIFWRGKVLVLKRKEDDFARPGAWDLPGGNSEWPESKEFLENPHLDDIVREVKEETGIKLNKESLTPVAVFSGYVPEKERYTIIIGWHYNLEKPPGKIKLTEHQEYQWLPPEEALNLDFGEGGDYLKEIIRSRRDFRLLVQLIKQLNRR